AAVESSFQTRDYVYRNFRQRVRQTQSAFVYPLGLRVGRAFRGLGQILGSDAAVDVGNGGSLVGVRDYQPAPVLVVARGGRLHGQPHALENYVAFDRPCQVEALTYRPRGGEQLVDRGDVHGRSDVDGAGLVDAEHRQ